MLYLILIIRLISSCLLLREGFQGNRRFPELLKEGVSGGTLVPLRGRGFRGTVGSLS